VINSVESPLDLASSFISKKIRREREREREIEKERLKEINFLH